jgi:hypothetical protein
MSRLKEAQLLLSRYILLTDQLEDLLGKLRDEEDIVKPKLNKLLSQMNVEEKNSLFEQLKHDSVIKFHVFKTIK